MLIIIIKYVLKSLQSLFIGEEIAINFSLFLPARADDQDNTYYKVFYCVSTTFSVMIFHTAAVHFYSNGLQFLSLWYQECD